MIKLTSIFRWSNASFELRELIKTSSFLFNVFYLNARCARLNLFLIRIQRVHISGIMNLEVNLFFGTILQKHCHDLIEMVTHILFRVSPWVEYKRKDSCRNFLQVIQTIKFSCSIEVQMWHIINKEQKYPIRSI